MIKIRQAIIIVSFIVFVGWFAILLVPSGIKDRVTLTPIAFSQLDGWQDDTQGNALLSFRTSCGLFLSLPSGTPNEPKKVGGVADQWVDVCIKANDTLAEDHSASRKFFEDNFTALSMSLNGETKGLLTGYYEPLIEGSINQSEEYSVPLYLRPPELVTVNLGLFRDDLRGRRVAGRVIDGRLQPFESRGEIEDGALRGRNLELLWLKHPVDAFFLHIQGSGRVVLEDGRSQKVGYAGPNGHPYTAIGANLIQQGFVSRSEMSMQKIKQWIETNPQAGKELMRKNASYIFFRLLDGDSPIGSQGVELTPGRSLAVDRTQIPLGAPMWLNGTRPSAHDPNGEAVPFNRLVVAQDTGGAIIGGLRGDVFWGVGADAETIAGHMKNLSEFTILLPNALARHIIEGESSAR
jgi:membrane-bound lytic murein transglycosylase A